MNITYPHTEFANQIKQRNQAKVAFFAFSALFLPFAAIGALYYAVTTAVSPIDIKFSRSHEIQSNMDAQLAKSWQGQPGSAVARDTDSGWSETADSAYLSPADIVDNEFKQQLELLSKRLDARLDRLKKLEGELSPRMPNMRELPKGFPMLKGAISSAFGWRMDPFTQRQAFHQGLDIVAEIGTPVFSFDDGVVVASAYHPGYGNMVEVKHGNGLQTRYAHASKRLVKVGDAVRKGQKIAEVGSTGRSNGPHLHFEVRYKGIALNPGNYLLKIAG